MKNILWLVLFLYSVSLLGQSSYRIFYKVESKPTIEKDSVVIDFYLFDIYPNERLSMFYSNAYYKSDSIMSNLDAIAKVSGGTYLDFNKFGKTHWNKGVLYDNDQMYSIEYFDGDSYKYADNNKINWRIHDEKKKCGEYTCQKATSSFKGRTWQAWFASEIPLNIFPYKFLGLPGLVHEISDSTNSYSFTFLGITKIYNHPFYPTFFSKAISTTKNKYLKAYANYKNDPSKKLKEGKLVTDGGETMEIFGGFSKKFIEEKTKSIYKELAKSNNPIEIE